MARHARQESSTGYYHVMMRGINREFLFKRENEKRIFMELVKEQQGSRLVELAGWCIMDNHVHMILKADMGNMSKAMKIISLKFAAYYNNAYERSGPVFGDRYRSENIENDAYLLGALRYVHLNPVKARIIPGVSGYQWSSYREYEGRATYISEEQKAFVLDLFGGSSLRFAEFHGQQDDNEYLETQEDLEAYREEKAAQVLETFCKEMGIESASQLHSNPELFSEVCLRLTQNAKLTLRQAAALLETTHNKVYQAVKG